ncbi:MAG: TlyA family RNA methyltransferase [Clostridia bacterium]|nr:TlyA family RNA methyltransferase [Clostridia bacterium]
MKERLDVLLVQQGFFSSRERAKTAIMEGLVYVNGAISDKPGMSIKEDAVITVKNDPCPYVGRGGLKLEKALNCFSIDLQEAVCMDIGASTGGFTDCMLAHGARQVYAIDVGYGQLAYKLRQDPRVVNMERCNFRYFDTEKIGCAIDFMSVDVSFISLALILPVASVMLKPAGSMVCLVKPQFEAGREQVGKNGIVRDPAVQEEVIGRVCQYAQTAGLSPAGLSFSPITGAKGNIEYLLYLNKAQDVCYNLNDVCIHQTVTDSHRELL